MISVRKSVVFTSLGLVLFLFLSCNEEDEVGLGVLPQSGQPEVFTKDITGLTTYTVTEDSLLTNAPRYFFLGRLEDNETGKTYTSFYAQANLGSTITATTFNSYDRADEVVLSLAYLKDGIYGTPNIVHHIKVYQLDSAMSKDALYYSTDTFKRGVLIGQLDLIPDVTAQLLRIPLKLDLPINFLQELQFHNSDFASSYFKGIYVEDSTENDGNIISLDATSSLNRITIYYRIKKLLVNPNGEVLQKLKLELPLNGARSLRFRHYYSGSYGVSQQIADSLNPKNNDKVYVQSLAGLKTKIILPDLNTIFNNKPASINRADLIVTVKDSSDIGVLNHHEALLLFASDLEGNSTFTTDFFDLGGAYDASIKGYKLNLTRHLQRILNGSVKDYGLYVVAGGSISNPRRTVLNGGVLNGGAEMKIHITYTQQKN